MARNANASGSANMYEQRIWKVSQSLDRLALMCEQHKRQMKPTHGKASPAMSALPAGVASRTHEHVPANFAWLDNITAAPMASPYRDNNSHTHDSTHDTYTTAIDPHGAAIASISVLGTTHDLRQTLDSDSAIIHHQQTNDFDTHQQTREALSNKTPQPARVKIKKTEVVAVDPSVSRHLGDIGSRRATDGMPEIHRRRKVQFADHGRSYRGIPRAKRLHHLTYHEALQAVAPMPSGYSAQATTKGDVSTYQHDYPKGTSQTLFDMMDRVGGITAGGESRYERRHVFTADDAMNVAKQSARELLKRRGPENALNGQKYQEPSRSGEENSNTSTQEIAVEDVVGSTFASPHSGSVMVPSHSPVETDRTASTQEVSALYTPREVGVEILSLPVRLDASTQTEAGQQLQQLKAPTPSTATKKLRSEPAVSSVQPHHQASGCCSHCGRRDDVVPPTAALPKRTPRPTTNVRSAPPFMGREEPPVRQVRDKPIRASRRTPQPNIHRFNPIFANTRYPPEPPVFRAKTTYSSSFGSTKRGQPPRHKNHQATATAMDISEASSSPLTASSSSSSKKPPPLVRVHPRYVRLRQGSELRYHVKLLRPPTKGRGVTIHVCVVNNKCCGITVQPSQVVVSASDWRVPREVVISCDLDAEIRTIQIYHKIHESSDDVYSSNTIIPSVFVSVLQKEATFLFAFGCGLHGRLGTADETNANVPTPFTCKWLHPVQLACGKAHSALIDVYSNIYCFGSNANGQLGQGDSANLEPSKLPLRVPSVGTSTILQVACGSNHTICLTTEGKVFTWGDNSCGQLGLGSKSTKPRGTPSRVEKVVHVRGLFCGGNQSFLVSMDNNVLATGSNIAGQLGLGDRTDRVIFERVPFFRKFYALSSSSSSRDQLPQASAAAAAMMPLGDVVELACGLYHTMALCGKRVYSWGNSDDGRLGHAQAQATKSKKDADAFLEPTLVDALKEVLCKSIACGGSHSGAIAANGDVYTWGNGTYGQTGHGTTRNRTLPTKVRLLQQKGVTQLSFGEWHSMALCENGTLYAWGFGEEGQLGLPDDVKQKHTRIVPLPVIVSAVSGTGATTVRCGGAHTFVVTVLESRRPQLAKLHRKASRMEILNEVTRLATLQRQKSLKKTGLLQLPNDHHHQDQEPTDVRLLATLPLAAVPADGTGGVDTGRTDPARSVGSAGKTNSGLSQKASHPWRRQPPHEEENEEEIERLDFCWKERPLSSRTAVRNALRQEIRVVTELKEILTPRRHTSAPPSCERRRAQSAGNGSAVVSPRLQRLHDQVVRASEAGVARTRTQMLVGSDKVVATEIENVVSHATSSLLRGGISARLTAPRSKRPDCDLVVMTCATSPRVNCQEDASDLSGSSRSSCDDSDGDEEEDNDDEIEVCVRAGARCSVASMEKDIRSR